MASAWLAAALLLCAPPPPPEEAVVERAERAFLAGDYARAAAGFAEAFATDPKPRYLYAQAQAERLAGNCPRAVQLYDQFLTLDPPQKAADDARANRARCVDVVPPRPTPPPPRTKDPPKDEPPPTTSDGDGPRPRPWYRDPWGGALVGSGFFVGGIGVGLLVSASQLDAEAGDAPNEGEYEAIRDDAQLRQRIGIGITAVGGALVIGGIVRWALVGSRSSRHAAFVPTGRGLALVGHF